MSGQEESQVETTKQKLASFEKVLNEYTEKLGIGNITYNPIEVQNAMDLTFEQILRLSEEECAAHSFVLSKFAFYLKKEQNRQLVRIEWAKTNLNSLLAKEGSKYGDSYVKYDMKMSALCNDNSHAGVLSQIVLHANARAVELNDLAGHINTISRTLNENRQTKRKFYGNAS